MEVDQQIVQEAHQVPEVAVCQKIKFPEHLDHSQDDLHGSSIKETEIGTRIETLDFPHKEFYDGAGQHSLGSVSD